MTTRLAPLAVLAASLAFASSTAFAQTCPDPAAITKGVDRPLAAVRYLADDALAGRRAGTDGERCAAEYIASEFARLGLAPAGEQGTWFQSLPLASALNPHAPGGTGRNVIAALRGSDEALRNEWVVIGAHYDHLGEGGAGSLAPNEKAIHNGADDNASGVAAMLAAAARLTAGPAPARSVLFIAFTGEEAGLLGSAYFVKHLTVGAGRVVGMINLDMVGRLGQGTLIVYGVDTAQEWRGLVDPAAARAGLPIAVRGEGYGPSDHTSFYTADIPVLHLFTNTHGDYHKPSDDWDKIDVPGLEKVTAMVADIATSVANRRPALTLRRGAGEPPRASSASSGTAAAYLGTVPDFTPVDRGVKLSGVTAGSPADKATLKAGDIVIGIGTHDVPDLQGMTDALRAYKPGDTVTVKVIRDGETKTFEVTLGSRAGR
ncbi:MAG: M20/M25/M40 family metallo-hydrolase [Acidobacteria bacterium]|nr:M20/M25/M40 family metallo-hydrolase [Acidobacteriota bacterium]